MRQITPTLWFLRHAVTERPNKMILVAINIFVAYKK